MPVERVGNTVRVHPVGAVAGTVRLPGSKSLTNRYLTCTALADGESTLRGASLSSDTLRMVAGLQCLGVQVEVREEGPAIRVQGCRGHLPADDAELDAGDAGTAMRFLTALACLGYGRFRLDGSVRMRARPIGQLVDGLHAIGAGIGYEGVEGYPPLTIVARGLAGGEIEFDRPPSSQYISAILMVSPYAAADVMIRVNGPLVSRPYVDMTIAVMRSLAVEVLSAEGRRFIVPNAQRYRAGEVNIEPDASAASYFWAAAAVTGGRVRVRDLTRASFQGDVRFVDVLERMGCRVNAGDDYIEVQGPPVGALQRLDVDLNEMPDVVQTLAVVALFAKGVTRIRNVANLRIKETDRLAALGTELTKLGGAVEVSDDGLAVTPPARVTPATINTYNDHRMAMSFALAGLAVDGIVIKDADCVSKSFPDYFDALAGLGVSPKGS
ncbi:MAG TPA: 3-phosphoshikimate 1-carboxyvinyltransferase [Phycisphaerae bacterium]|nr:3-phosphoshikimate 1-carboxyvinyltransferase [Phycisphaerae bacterium]